MTSKTFTHEFTLKASLADVAAFHHNPLALKRLTPSLVPVVLHRVEPLADGSITEFTLWLGPLPLRWVAEHSNVDRLHGFADRQIDGPFSYWNHTHTFTEIEPGHVQVKDEIEYGYGKGVFKGLVSRLMAFGLPFMFIYRAWQTRRLVEHI